MKRDHKLSLVWNLGKTKNYRVFWTIFINFVFLSIVFWSQLFFFFLVWCVMFEFFKKNKHFMGTDRSLAERSHFWSHLYFEWEAMFSNIFFFFKMSNITHNSKKTKKKSYCFFWFGIFFNSLWVCGVLKMRANV